MTLSRKRGRPRAGTPRPQVDLGTPEVQARRKALLAHAARAGWPKPDIAAVENALGLLLWQGLLHEDYEQARRMHDAGVTFAGWWVLVYPKTFTQGTLGRFLPGGATLVDAETAEINLKAASAYLAKHRAALDAVINTAVYQRLNLREVENLRAGLCRLIAWQRMRRQRAA